MKTYAIKDSEGRECAFEVNNCLLSRNGLCRLVARIPGCIVTRKPSLFRWSCEDEEEFCKFELDGVRFAAWEPWGDNIRYWVGPKVDEGNSPTWCPQLDRVKESFRRARPLLGRLLGPRVSTPEPPPAAAVLRSLETVNPRPEKESPTDSGGR